MRRVLKTLAVLTLALVGLIVGVGAYTTDGPHEYAPVSAEQQAEARAYLAAAQLPMPEGATFGWFDREAGVRLETLTLDHPEPKGTVVISPGFSAPLEIYVGTFTAFHDAGYRIVALSPRGQGRSWRPLPNPEKGHVADYDVLADDLAAFVAAQPGPVFVYGNSMGGHVAMLMAESDAPSVIAYGLVVPMAKIRTDPFPYGFARAIGGVFTTFGFGDNFGIGQGDWRYDLRDITAPYSCSAETSRAHTRHTMVALDPALRVEGVTNRWVWETIDSTAERADPARLARIDKPVLTITAGDDRLVDSEASEANCAAMPSCLAKRYDAARHCIMHEGQAQKDAVHADVIAFFNRVNVK